MDLTALAKYEPRQFLEYATRKPPFTPPAPGVTDLHPLQEFIEEKEEALSHAPEGKLVIASPRRGSSNPEFYLSHNGHKTYLPAAQKNIALSLAQKEYDQKQLQAAQKLYGQLSRSMPADFAFPETSHTLRPERQALISPDFLPNEMVREYWSQIEFESLGFSENYPEYYLTNNQRVRSIAERRIGDRLLEREVLFLYEFPLKLQDGGIVYPDFTCLNLRTRKLILWEHLGRLDEGSYLEKNLRKLERYRRSGYQLCVDLIVSQDTNGNPFSQGEIDHLIDTFLV